MGLISRFQLCLYTYITSILFNVLIILENWSKSFFSCFSARRSLNFRAFLRRILFSILIFICPFLLFMMSDYSDLVLGLVGSPLSDSLHLFTVCSYFTFLKLKACKINFPLSTFSQASLLFNHFNKTNLYSYFIYIVCTCLTSFAMCNTCSFLMHPKYLDLIWSNFIT